MVSVEEGHRLAHLQYPRAGAVSDVVAERLRVAHVGGHEQRAAVLVAPVDDGVELLQAPLVLLGHGEVLEHEEVHAAEQLEQAEVGVLRALLVGRADASEQLGAGEDGERAALAEHLLRHAPRQAGLPTADLAEEVEAAPAPQVVLEATAVLAHLAHDPLVEVRDRPALEVDLEVAPRDRGGQPRRPRRGHALPAAGALTRAVPLLDLDPAAAVALAVAAWLRAHAPLAEMWRAAWNHPFNKARHPAGPGARRA